jgi:hypothetical protein
VTWPDHTAIALLITLELASTMTSAQAFEEIGRTREARAPDTPLGRFCRALDEAGALDDIQIAVPADRLRMAQLVALQEGAGHGQLEDRARQAGCRPAD